MTQAYKKIVEIKNLEIEELEIQIPEENEIDELFGNWNPRYFEERITLKERQGRSYVSGMDVGSKFNFFSAF